MSTPTRPDRHASHPYMLVLSTLFFVDGAYIVLDSFFGVRDVWQGVVGLFICLFSVALWWAWDARQRHLPSVRRRLILMSVLIAGAGVSIILDTLSHQ